MSRSLSTRESDLAWGINSASALIRHLSVKFRKVDCCAKKRKYFDEHPEWPGVLGLNALRRRSSRADHARQGAN
jgi:hypothetical protein